MMIIIIITQKAKAMIAIKSNYLKTPHKTTPKKHDQTQNTLPYTNN